MFSYTNEKVHESQLTVSHAFAKFVMQTQVI